MGCVRWLKTSNPTIKADQKVKVNEEIRHSETRIRSRAAAQPARFPASGAHPPLEGDQSERQGTFPSPAGPNPLKFPTESPSPVLDFSDQPYQFFPPRSNGTVRTAAAWWNRRVILPGPSHRVQKIVVHGTDRLPPASAAPRLLFLPNHPTHSDPQIMAEVQRRLGRPSCFMAAYDVFLRNRFCAWIMQRCGAFSVDRESSDPRALQTAEEILREGRDALTVFPEGNVFLMNDRLTPFLDGAAYLGLRAQAALSPAFPILAVPVAIKATYRDDILPAVRARLESVARDLGTALDPALPFPSEIRRIGLLALQRNLKQRGHPSPEITAPEGDPSAIPALIRQSAERIVLALEHKMELQPHPRHTIQDRVRRIRRTVHRIRTGGERPADQRAAALWSDEATLALRVLSYSGDYLDRPSLDRCAETVEKLAEDLYGKPLKPFGAREVHVELLPPIDLRDHMDDYSATARGATRALTALCEQSVQSALDRLHSVLSAPGNRLVDHAENTARTSVPGLQHLRSG